MKVMCKYSSLDTELLSELNDTEFLMLNNLLIYNLEKTFYISSWNTLKKL